ncbi:uncharacterized protein EDB91DRAFT_1083775 [Suillus paluster]|uniref:uncharacterized protein n=1 Tax=Suillus paluster TaxID=48578 RepID=UPI001B860C58|nr:uncharacterized protein EDB91DRAFT_1083775 [Suillus paluster]KAG1735321.1 hypothetical protein EDB91DRAFT_1083775 [Suillus paluster]
MINLILVSADKAKFKTWRQQLAELNTVLPISCMAVNESHLPLLSDNFRESMWDMLELRQFSMQLLLLSGMIPPSSIPALKIIFGLTDKVHEIRQSSNWPELEYILKPPASSSDIEEETIQIIANEWKEWSTKDRGLVFIVYMQDGESVAEKTGWPFYNRDKETSDATRARYYKSWFQGETPMPMEMTELIQAQGRGGRDGQHTRCYVLLDFSPAKITIGRLEVDHKGLWHARDYAYKNSIACCLRHASTEYIDGVGTWCKDNAANQQCSFCKKGPKGLSQGRAPLMVHLNDRQTSGESHVHEQMTSLKRMIEEILTNSGDPFLEAVEKAKKSRKERLEGEMMEVEPLVAGEVTCKWPDIVVPIGFGILRDDKLQGEAEKKFKVDWKNNGEVFATWPGKKPEKRRLSNRMDLLLCMKDEGNSKHVGQVTNNISRGHTK